MWRFLVGLGFLLALAGLVIMALGVAIFVSSFGNTLITTGAVSLAGGLVMIAIGMVLKELGELNARLDALLMGGLPVRTLAPAPMEDELEDEPAPFEEAEAPEPELPAEAPQRGFTPPAFPRQRGFERPAAAPLTEPTSQVPEALKRGRVLGRTPEGESFASRMRPLEPPPAPEMHEPEPMPEPAPPPAPRSFSPPPRAPEPVPAAAPEPSVLKSGIVGGMAYTLYSDGSIQAELPDGTLRFGSLQELRDHVARSVQPR